MTLTLAAVTLPARPAAADSGLVVFAGYMDTHAGAPQNPPDPWPVGSPNFIGTSCCWDSAAIRLDNPSGGAMDGVGPGTPGVSCLVSSINLVPLQRPREATPATPTYANGPETNRNTSGPNRAC